MKKLVLILSCEHAVNSVPKEYKNLFHNNEPILKSHLGHDIGAKKIARHLQHKFKCQYREAIVTRLIIDCNRSLKNRSCFSEFTRDLPAHEKKLIIDHYYRPYREDLTLWIKTHVEKGHQVLHLSIHSFTPLFNEKERNAAIGLLYDPKRHGEKEVVRTWRGILLTKTPTYVIRSNYPYKGTSDGFTGHLRKQFKEQDYLGIEVEINQALLQEEVSLQEVAEELSESLNDLLQMM